MSHFNQFSRPTDIQANGQVVRNKVLRNTYMLLALSLVPTVLGAVFAMQLNLFAGMSSWMSMIIFFAGAFGLMYLVEKNKHSGMGVAFLMLFTFFMGMMLSRILTAVLNLSNGADIITMAFGGTAVIFAVMAGIATTSKHDFSFMNKALMIGVIVIILAAIANVFMQVPTLTLTIASLAVIIFSLLMLVDIQRIVNGGETNYISASLALYLDIYNVFVSLLQILGITSGDD